MREEREKKFGFWLLLGFQSAERERERERKKKSPRHPSPPPPPFPLTPPNVVTIFLSPSTSRLCLDRFLSLTAQLGAIVQTRQRRDKFSIFSDNLDSKSSSGRSFMGFRQGVVSSFD
ncbi:hypothetical protein Q3G72_006077 [Acer saccharum]|nr:hypothetical protein Q3G72_006077 [Acer saccharum]